jgi:hypothetical protein
MTKSTQLSSERISSRVTKRKMQGVKRRPQSEYGIKPQPPTLPPFTQTRHHLSTLV